MHDIRIHSGADFLGAYRSFFCGMFETFFFRLSIYLPAYLPHIGRAADDVESEFLRTGSIAPSFFFVGKTRQAR